MDLEERTLFHCHCAYFVSFNTFNKGILEKRRTFIASSVTIVCFFWFDDIANELDLVFLFN